MMVMVGSLVNASPIAGGSGARRASGRLNLRGGRTGATRSHAEAVLHGRAWRGPDGSGRVLARRRRRG
jgi:hypothetical protein